MSAFTSTAVTKLKPLLFAFLGVLSTLGILSLTHIGPAQAQSPGVSLASLVAQLNALTFQASIQAGQISTLQAQNTALQARASALETKTAPLSVSGTDLTVTGVNVHIINGLDLTQTQNGLGNLIVGYNAPRQDGTDARTGSHNLILGDFNNYSSYGGLVAGRFNTASGQYASISGGQNNTAGGQGASISGGFNLIENTPNGWMAGSLGSTAAHGNFSSP